MLDEFHNGAHLIVIRRPIEEIGKEDMIEKCNGYVLLLKYHTHTTRTSFHHELEIKVR